MVISNDKEFNRYQISRDDFEQALEYLKKIDGQRADLIVHEALLSSAIVCYARPFSPNEKQERLAAAKSRIELSELSPLSVEENALHSRLIDIRNKAVAHAEWSYFPVELSRSAPVSTSTRYSVLSESLDLDLFSKLSEKLRRDCDYHCGMYATDESRMTP